jgi:hypothetical protein
MSLSSKDPKSTAKPTTGSSGNTAVPKDVNKDLFNMLLSVKQYPVDLSSPEQEEEEISDEEQANATQHAESETAPTMQVPEQIAVFASI